MRRISAAVVVAFLWTAARPAAAAGTGIAISTSVADGTEQANNRKLVRAANGDLYAVRVGTNAGFRHIFLNKSVDNGSSWTEVSATPIVHNGDNKDQVRPALAIDSLDNLHLVWQGNCQGLPGCSDSGGEEMKLQYSSSAAGGTSWGAWKQIPGHIYQGGEGDASLIVDGNDYLHVVWHGEGPGGNYGVRYSSRPAAGGEFWSAYSDVMGPAAVPNHFQNASITIDSSDILQVVAHGGSSPGQIRHSSKSLTTAAWSAPQNISNLGGFDQQFAVIAADGLGQLHAVWNGKDAANGNYQIKYAKRSAAQVWIAPVNIAPIAAANAYNPSIAVSATGNLHAVWHGSDTVTSVMNIKHSTNAGGGWSPWTNISAGSSDQTFGNLRWAPRRHNGGTPDLVWSDNGVSPNNIRFSSSSLEFGPAPALAGPVSGAYISTMIPTLVWAGAFGSTFTAQIATDAGFATVAVASTSPRAFLISTTTLATGTTYWWRVRDAESDKLSPTASFVIDAASPAYSGPQVSTAAAPWTSLPMTTYLSSNVVTARITLQDTLSGLLVSSGPPSGLAGQWHFDESSGTTVLDASGISAPGNFSGGPGWGEGKRGGALDLASDGSFVQVPHDPAHNASELTIEMWIKPSLPDFILTGGDPFMALAAKRTSNSQTPYVFGIRSGGTLSLNWWDSLGGFPSPTSPPIVKVNAWQHIAVTRTGSPGNYLVTFYYNGAPFFTAVDGAPGTVLTSAQDLLIGKDVYFQGQTTQGTYRGLVDEVRVFNVARSSAQVLADYQSDTLAAHNRGKAYAAQYSTNGGLAWNFVSTNSVTLTGADGATGPQTLTAANIPLATSTAALAPTNLIRFIASDMAGNVGTTTYAVLVDTTSPAPPACGKVANVRKNGFNAFTTISAAVASLPQSLTDTTCVVVRDTQTYSEQVVVQGFANNGYQLIIMSDPSFVSSAPLVSAAAMPSFVIKNASVTLRNFMVRPNGAANYGVQASSAYVTLSSVNVDAGAFVNFAGIELSSWSVLSNSSITVQSAHGLLLKGVGSVVSFSTMTNNAAAPYSALYVSQGSSNTITNSYISNLAGYGAYLDATSSNTISFSTMTSAGTFTAGLYLSGSSSNTVTSSYIQNPVGHGLTLSGAHYNTIRLSTFSSSAGGRNALYLVGASSWNTISQSLASNPNGSGAWLDNASFNTISLSTLTSNAATTNYALYLTNSDSNTVTGSYIQNLSGTAARLDSGSENNTIGLSTVVSNAASYYALYFNGVDSNTVTGSYIANPSGNGVSLFTGADFNTISLSTVISNAVDGQALSIFNADSNTVTGTYLQHLQGWGAFLDTGADYNTISLSTMISNSVARYALHLNAASTNTISRSYVSNTGGTAARLEGGSAFNTLSQSTFTTNYAFGHGLQFVAASSNTVTQSVVFNANGFGARLTAGSNYNLVTQSRLTTGGGAYSAVDLDASSFNVITQSYLSGPGGRGASLDNKANRNTISFSTMTSNSGYYTLRLNEVSSTTISNCYIQDSTAVFVAGSTGTVISDSVIVGAAGRGVWMLNGSSGLTLASSTVSGSVGDAAIYLDGGNSGVVSLGSVTVTGSARGLEISTQAAGFVLAIDSVTFRGLTPDATAIHFLGGTLSSTITLANFEDAGIGANVSAAGLNPGSRVRMRAHSGPRTGPGFENDPNYLVFWQSGPYPGCAVTANVGPADAHVTISSGVAGLPTILTGNSCVVIRDGGTYVEQVVVEGFTNNGSSITILSDPAASTSMPRVSAPMSSLGAFVIRNELVNLTGFEIRPNGFMSNYGIFVSSPYVTISSVIVNDTFNINTAGISLSSWTTVSYASVTVGEAYAFLLPGSTMSTVSYSSATNNSGAGKSAVLLASASGNTLTGLVARNQSGGGGAAAVRFDGGGANSVSQSSFTSFSQYGLYLNGSATNTITGTYMSGSSGNGLRLDGANRNSISQSTAVSGMLAQPALYLGNSSSNSINGVFASNPSGYGAYLSNSSSNTLSLSTFTGGGITEYGLYITGGGSNTIAGSYASNAGGPAAYFFNTSSNTLSQSTIVGGAAYYGLQLNTAVGHQIIGSNMLTGADLFSGSNQNVITGSTFTQNSLTLYGLALRSVSSNTVAQCFMTNPLGYALAIGVGGSPSYNTVSQSTITSGTGPAALYVGGAGNSFVSDYIANSSGYGAEVVNANYSSILQSTITNNSAIFSALYLRNSATNTVTQSVIINGTGDGAYLVSYSSGNSFSQTMVRGGASGIKAESLSGLNISLSTVTGGSAGASAGVWGDVYTDYITLTHSYVQGSTAVYLSGSSRTVVNASVLAASGGGSGLYFANNSQTLSMSSNTVLGGGLAGIGVDSGSGGLIRLSTNTIISRGSYGIAAGGLSPAATLWITSNTIIPSLSASATTYGIFLNSLGGGATVQNNGIYYRTPGAAFAGLGAGAYGLYAAQVTGLRVDHNRISNPSMATSGNYIGAAIDSTSNAYFMFNDLYSTGSGLTTFNLLRLTGSSNASARNNILSSSMTATNNRLIVVDAASQAGFSSDYNTYFSSNAFYSGVWGVGAVSLLANWIATTGRDANTLNANPRWADPAAGVEDFHPLSREGRWNGAAFVQDAVDSPVIDRADPAEVVGEEVQPNGARANQGSYGQALEGSQTVLPCPVTRYVRQAGGGDATTIQGGIAALPNPIVGGHSCVIIGDSGIYDEAVTIQGFTNNGSSITIMLDPSLTAHPTVRRGFTIKNASVNVVNIDVAPTVFTIPYGLSASSADIKISSVVVTDPGGFITAAGVALSSYSSLSYSSISVQGAHGLRLDGKFAAVTNSTMTSNSSGFYALYIPGADSNTVTGSYISNALGYGARIEAGADNNTISLSTMLAGGAGAEALTLTNAVSNVVTGSYIQSLLGSAARLNAGSVYNTISFSTMVANAAAYASLYLVGADSNTMTGNSISNAGGIAAFIDSGADYNTISLSTMTSNSTGYALRMDGARFNTVTGSYLSNPLGYGAGLLFGASYNTISQSSMTSSAGSYFALYINNADSNTVTGSNVSNAAGWGAFFESGADYNTISQSTVTSNSSSARALGLLNSDFNAVTGSLVSNPAGISVYLDTGSDYNTIIQSTVTSNSAVFSAFYVVGASSNAVLNSYIQGSTAAIVSGSTGTVISSSVLVATNTAGSALTLTSGGVNLAMSSNTIFAGTQGQGIYLEAGNTGAIVLSTNTVYGGRYGVYIATQQAGTTVWITSNTVVPAPSGAFFTYGLRLNGLISGATIQNNGFYYRSPGATGPFYTTPLDALSSGGLVITGNRFSNPGMITGNALGVGLTGTPNTVFKFNDVHSTGTSIVSAYHMRLTSSPGAQLLNNVFSSSWSVTTTTSALFVDAASQVGFVSNYNDFFSSNSLNTIEWGTGNFLLFPWTATTGQDGNSIARHPRWKDVSPGVEDFHQLSQEGRWDGASFVNDGFTSALLDAGDPLESVGAEAAPHGGRANLGSYGRTAEASKTPPPPGSPIVAAVFTSSISVSYGLVASDGYVLGASTAADLTGTLFSSTTANGALAALAPQGLAANTTYFLRAAATWGDFLSVSGVLVTTATLANSPAAAAPAFGAVGVSSLTVSWEPNGNGLGVSTYSVVLTTGAVYPNFFAANQTFSTTPAAGQPTATRTGLLQNTTYHVFVAALNWHGMPSSYTLVGSTPTMAEVPLTAVTTFSAVGSSSFTVSWNANGNLLSITTYTVQVSTAPDFNAFAASVTFSTVPASGPSATFTGLGANELYYFRVRALNHQGVASAYAVLGSTLTRPVTLTAPVVAGFVEVNASSITATWSLSALATGYTLVASLINNPAAFSASSSPVGISATTATVFAPPLNPNTTYFLFVQATGPGAATGFSAFPATATLAAAPLTAVSTFSGVNLTSVTVSWLPNGNPVGVTTYTVILSTGSIYPNSFFGNRAVSTMPAGAIPAASVTGLNDNTLYYLYVAGVNHNGLTGAFAALGSTVTRISPPAAVVFDEISSNTIVASAYAPSPLLSNLGTGLSGTQVARNGAYQAVHGEQWTAATAIPAALRDAGAAGFNGKVYVFGGFNGSVAQNTARMYDPATTLWTALPNMTFTRGGLAAASAGGKVYAVGGTPDGATSLTTNEEYDPVANSWTTKAPLPDGSDHLSAAGIGGALYAFGGVTTGVDNSKAVQYDPVADAWTNRPDFPAGQHQMAAAAAAGPTAGMIIAAGGSGPVNSNYAYDTIANAWSVKAAMPAAVEEAAAASLGGKIYVIGGAPAAKTVYEYDFAADTWVARGGMITGRAGLSAVAAGGRIYAMGGSADGGTTSLNANEEYDPGVATKFTGLVPNTLALFKARSRNQAGTLSAETAVVSTWTWAALPGAVAPAFTVVAVDSVTFVWGLNGNPGATEFKARTSTSSSFGGGAAVLTSDWGAMTSTATLALTPNTTYFFSSQARNGVAGVPGIQTAWVTLGSTATLAAVPAPAPVPYPSAATNGLTVSWLPNGNPLSVTTYTVVVSTEAVYPNANTGNFMIASTQPAGALPTATLTGLLANTTYFAFASAVNWNGLRTAYAALGSTSTLALPPAAAAPTFAAVHESSATFSWLPNGNPVNVTTYSVVLSTGSAYNTFFGNVVLSTTPAGALPTATALAGLTPNTTYFAYAAASNSNGAVSAFTPLGSTATLAAAPLTAVTTFSAVNIASITVSWSANGNPLAISSYTVQLSTDSFATIAVSFTTAPAAGPSATFNGLDDYKDYFFRVRAVNHGGNVTGFVNLGSTRTLLAPLAVPALAGFPSVDIASITATWGLVAGATGYTLIASSYPANPPTVVAASSTTFAIAATTAAALLPALDSNTTYYLFVRANGNLRSSLFAAYGATSTLASPPATAVSTFTGVGITSFTVSWSANGNALAITTYTVQLSTASDFNAFATSITYTTAPVFGPSAMLTGLSGNTSYYLRVRSLNHNGVPSAFVNLGSTLTVASPLFPTILNSQAGDAVWRRANTTLYSVAFLDTSGAHLDKFQVKASTTAGGLGTDIAPFTDVVIGLLPADNYNTPWALPASVFNSLLEGVTNYITVKVFNGPPLNNFTVLQDAFYVQKDTTAPVIVNTQAGDAVPRSVAGTIYTVGVRDPSSGLAAFQYSASLSPVAANAEIIGWTDIAVVANTTSYTTAWPVNFPLLVSGVTNYISVRSWDVAGATTNAVAAFYVHKDTTGPSVAIAAPQDGSFNSSLGQLSGTAASLYGVQGTEVSIRDTFTALYWNPASAAFNSAAQIMIPAAGTTAWTLAPGIPWIDGRTYQAVARSSTTANIYSTIYATATFVMDLSTPTVGVLAPAPDSTVSVLPQISGTAADPAPNPSGLATVEVRLRRNADGLWWNWFAQTWGVTAVSSVTAGTAAWSLTPTPELKASLKNGSSYFIAVRAADNALPANTGNFFVSGATFTWQDVTPPSAVANLAASHGSAPGRIDLSWTAPGDDAGAGPIALGEYRIFYSTDIAAVASTSAAQVVIATAGVYPGTPQSYTVIGLNPGTTYYLRLALDDGDGNWSNFSNQATTTAAPSPLNAITGHVLDISTQGITAVQVDCWNAADALMGTTFTLADGSGTYTVNGLPPGNYKLRVTWTVNGFSSSLWQDGIAMGSTNVDFFLNINYALATLTGTLSTLTTSSFGGGGLSAAAAADSFIELYQQGRQVARAAVQPGGRWTIAGLLPGSYSVRAHTGLGYTAFQDVELAEGEVRVLGFVFNPLPEAAVFAFPNPARTATTIRFETALAPLEAGIYIFDLAGNLVKEIPDSQIGRAAAPVYRATWDLNNSSGRSVAPGVYNVMVKIKGGSDNQTAKVIKKLAVVR